MGLEHHRIQGIGEGRLDHSVGMLFTTYAGMDMGRDNGGVVDLDYEDKAPYAFTGTLNTASGRSTCATGLPSML